jgi:hypothetical protein
VGLASNIIFEHQGEECFVTRVEYVEPRCHAAYAFANHGKRVAEKLELKMVECFPLLYEPMRRRKDHCKRLQLPLAHDNDFLRLAIRDLLQVLQIPSVNCAAEFDGIPTLSTKEIVSLSRALVERLRVDLRARIVPGPLAGLNDILKSWHCDWSVVPSAKLSHKRSIFVGVAPGALEFTKCHSGSPPNLILVALTCDI